MMEEDILALLEGVKFRAHGSEAKALKKAIETIERLQADNEILKANWDESIDKGLRLQAENTKLRLTPCKFHAGGVCAISQENQRLQAKLEYSEKCVTSYRLNWKEAEAKNDILADALSEVKAVIDGNSTQSLFDIINGCISEIAAQEDK